MIILGIDPGTATTGFGVIKVPDDILSREFNYDLELIDYGNISTSKVDLMPKRLVHLYQGMKRIITKFQPDLIVIELLFFGANSRTAISVGQARGVVMLAAGSYRISIQEYTSPQVKLMVAGSGRADKKEVHDGVRRFLGSNKRRKNKLKTPKGGHLDDSVDALAIAICHVLKLVNK